MSSVCPAPKSVSFLYNVASSVLIDRIIELESIVSNRPLNGIVTSHGASTSMGILPAHSGGGSRVPFAQRSEAGMMDSVRQAMNEMEYEDMDADPRASSRHVGPNAKRRQQVGVMPREDDRNANADSCRG